MLRLRVKPLAFPAFCAKRTDRPTKLLDGLWGALALSGCLILEQEIFRVHASQGAWGPWQCYLGQHLGNP